MAYNAAPNMKNKYQQGYYVLKNPSKYIGDPEKIIYRSSLERKFCIKADLSEKIVKWGSEIVSIPYMGVDNKQHTYHIDFYAEVKNDENPTINDKLLIEVKPHVETMRIIENNVPQAPKKKTPTSLRNWEYAIKEFMKNKNKWVFADKYAKKRGMKFIVVTEKIVNKL